MNTPATRISSKQHGVAYTEHATSTSSTAAPSVSPQSLGVPEHEVVKTLVMEDEEAKPLIVLMHGDRKVSTKNLARQAGRKRIEPCKPEVAQRHSGYQVGGTSPFGTRKPLPVFWSARSSSCRNLHQRRPARLAGELEPRELVRVLAPQPVDVGARGLGLALDR